MNSNRDSGRMAARNACEPCQSTNKPHHVLTIASADNSRRPIEVTQKRLLMNNSRMPPATMELPIQGEGFAFLKMLSLRTRIKNALIGGIRGMYEYSELPENLTMCCSGDQNTITLVSSTAINPYQEMRVGNNVRALCDISGFPDSTLFPKAPLMAIESADTFSLTHSAGAPRLFTALVRDSTLVRILFLPASVLTVDRYCSSFLLAEGKAARYKVPKHSCGNRQGRVRSYQCMSVLPNLFATLAHVPIDHSARHLG